MTEARLPMPLDPRALVQVFGGQPVRFIEAVVGSGHDGGGMDKTWVVPFADCTEIGPWRASAGRYGRAHLVSQIGKFDLL